MGYTEPVGIQLSVPAGDTAGQMAGVRGVLRQSSEMADRDRSQHEDWYRVYSDKSTKYNRPIICRRYTVTDLTLRYP